jgi:hypothetical protein
LLCGGGGSWNVGSHNQVAAQILAWQEGNFLGETNLKAIPQKTQQTAGPDATLSGWHVKFCQAF